MVILKLLRNTSAKVQATLSTIVKIILVLSILNAFYNHFWHILFANMLLLFLTFSPTIARKRYEVVIPREFEFVFLIFIIITFFLGELRGVIMQMFFGIALGFAGFLMMLILYSNNKIKKNYFLIAIFAFSVSVSLGLALEMAKYYLKIYLSYTMTAGDLEYTMRSLLLVTIGAVVSSVTGYIYMKGYKLKFLIRLAEIFKKENPNIFGKTEDTKEKVLDLIKGDESEKLEFKSTLRMNLYTHIPDKKIESSILKTITAFLNSQGGTLLVGIDDAGRILGIEKDRFQNSDKLALHFTNLFKDHIGDQYMPLIDFKLIRMSEEKTVLKVNCSKSNRPVFFKHSGLEEFYMRVGPASVRIIGSKLLSYIHYRFRKQ
ncbi:ATP-binding protein [Candidatus Pacearchaeota archaeon]|nr:ATP-binding protein [Candidatus Pacearchaeota archaeon]